MSFTSWLISRVLRRAPDFHIGSPPYLERWWIIPRNPIFNIYLHRLLRDDDPRALHDHPWVNCSIILRGSYWEIMPNETRLRRPGEIVFRRATASHRLALDRGAECWSLFITGPVVRVWGFHCPKGWVPWQQFVKPGEKGQIGAGCGE